MATSIKPIAIILVVLTLIVVSSEARSVPQLSTMEKKIDSKYGLREAMNYVRNGKWHAKRSMLGGRLRSKGGVKAMATPTSMKPKQIVMLVIVVAFLVVNSEARVFPELSTMGEIVDSEVGLGELMKNVGKSEWHQKRSMLGGRVERASPAGPDPQHH
ncbi:unnamed protein product [Sphenostylis stenocarpa]|uniref:Uncharacterized protein n=1 Tax=Sphenostylis stenocarpa TaxID=92480 RepID=A0AA86W4M7_9FABA|nr:unnamed protein product [Sphenostylis stenocarpa]